MADNEIIIEVLAKLDNVDNSLKKIEDKAEKTGKEIDKDLGKGLGKKISTGFKVGAAAIVASLAVIGAAAFKLRTAAIEAASVQEDAVNQLNQSLKSAGDFSLEASRSMQAYAASIEATTTIGDEAVINQLALARGFARTNEEAVKLVDAAIEMSAFTGNDLRSSVVNLGKSLGGLVGELGETVAETRDLTTEQLKAGGAIDLVKTKFDSFAAAQVNTYSGANKQLANTFGTLLEEIGFLITKAPGVTASFKFISEKVRDLTKAVTEFRNSGGLKTFSDGAFSVARFFTSVLGPVFEKTLGLSKLIITSFIRLGSVIANLLSGEFTKAFDGIKEQASSNFEFITEIFETPGTDAAVGFLDGFQKAIEEAPPVLEDFKNKTKKEVKAAGAEFKALGTLIGTTVNSLISGSLASLGGALVKGGSAFGAFAKTAANIMGDFFISLGTSIIAADTAIVALKASLLSFFGGGGIAAGIGLVIAGGALKAFAGGPSSAPGASASTTSAAATDAAPIGETLSSNFDTEAKEPGTSVTVNIEGNVLDRRETGLEIANVLNEVFSTNGIVIAKGALS